MTTSASTRTTDREPDRDQVRRRRRRPGRAHDPAHRRRPPRVRRPRRRPADLGRDGAARATRPVRRRPPRHQPRNAGRRPPGTRRRQQEALHRARTPRGRPPGRRDRPACDARARARARRRPAAEPSARGRGGSRRAAPPRRRAARYRPAERERRRDGRGARGRPRRRAHLLPHGRARPDPPGRRRAGDRGRRGRGADRARRARGRHPAQADGGRARGAQGRPRRDRRDGGGRVKTAVAAPLLPTYARQDVTFVRGEGAWLVDDAGRRYLDLLAGIAVVGLGHCHPAPLAAASAQLAELWHVSNLYWTEPMAALAARLSERVGGTQAYFCNSGTEAIEAALKWARKATGRPGLVALEGSFHGRTFGALSITGQPAKREAFKPLVPGVSFVAADDEDALAEAVGPDTAAIVLEPIQGEGGVHPLSPEFAAAPTAFEPGDHGSTFGGNPVACAAACAVLDELTDELLEGVRSKGAALARALAPLPGVTAVRGRGLLLGVELDRPAADVVAACLERGVVVGSAGERVLRLTPPLTITDGELDHGLGILQEVLDA